MKCAYCDPEAEQNEAVAFGRCAECLAIDGFEKCDFCGDWQQKKQMADWNNGVYLCSVCYRAQRDGVRDRDAEARFFDYYRSI